MRFSSFDARLNLASAKIVAIKNNQEIKPQLILFYVIYTNYNYKTLTIAKKPEMS